MENSESHYGIKTKCDNGKICIQTSRVYLSEEEFEDWVEKTREFVRKEGAGNYA